MGIYVEFDLRKGYLSRMGQHEILLSNEDVIMGNIPIQSLHNGAASATALFYGYGRIPIYIQYCILMGDWWQLALLQQPVQQERTCNEGYKYHPGQLLVSEYIFKPFFITVIYPVEQSVSLSICRIRPCIAVKQQIIYRNDQHRHKK